MCCRRRRYTRACAARRVARSRGAVRRSEGCEWAALARVAREAPWLLSRVRTLHIELHLTQALGLTNATQQLGGLLSFIVDAHGFRLFRRK